MTKKADIVCPHCGKKDTWQLDNPHRPFCCERCKLIDLGDWANEKHRIPGRQINDTSQQDISQQNPDENESNAD